MERIYRNRNGLIEKTRYIVGDRCRPRGKRKKGNASFRKQEQNFNAAIRRLARILNCNASHDNALLIGLDYSPEGIREIQGADPNETRDMAEKQAKLYIRRLKRKLKQEIKWVLVTADINGDTGEYVRPHNHLVLMTQTPPSWDDLKEAWHLGGCDIQNFSQQADYTPLAAYLMRQVRKTPDRKKYTCSRGMEQPVTEEREVHTLSEIHTPPGARVFERRYAEDERSQYVRYLPMKRKPKIGGHKEGGELHGIQEVPGN